jgi:hypothetical protein
LIDNDSSAKSGDIIYFNRHDFSPTSKASFTSISAHFVPKIIRQNSIKSHHPITVLAPPLVNKPLPKTQSVIYLNSTSPTAMKQPMIKISFIPAKNSTPIQIPQIIPQFPVNLAA